MYLMICIIFYRSYVCFYISEMSYSIRDKREKLSVMFYKVLTLPIKLYRLYESGMGLVVNVLKTAGQPIKK